MVIYNPIEKYWQLLAVTTLLPVSVFIVQIQFQLGFEHD